MVCFCSIEFILDAIGKKWAIIIIDKIGKSKNIRFNDLHSKIDGIGTSMLASKLKKLEDADLIIRKSFNEIPPKVEYSLSKKGVEFQQVITPLIEWTTKNYDKRCICNKIEQDFYNTPKIRNKFMKKLIEASMCACSCMAMMAVHSLTTIRIF